MTIDRLESLWGGHLRDGAVAYQESNNRYFNSLVGAPKAIRTPVLVKYGYTYDADIRCALHSLMLQEARKRGFDRKTPALDAYVADPGPIREAYAEKLGISVKKVKILFTMIMNGQTTLAYTSYKKAMHELLPSNAAAEWLKEDVWFTKFRREVKGVIKHLGLTAKDIMGFYMGLEKQVRDAVSEWAAIRKVHIVLIHDGWVTTHPIDPVLWVFDRTGFKINVSTTDLDDDEKYFRSAA